MMSESDAVSGLAEERAAEAATKTTTVTTLAFNLILYVIVVARAVVIQELRVEESTL